jgi:hypothetical protein
MSDERQDPDLEVVRSEWDAPPPRPGFDTRVLAAYQDRFRRRSPPRWTWPLAMGLAGATLVVVLLISRARPERRYHPVGEPHFYIISAGEHP